MKNFVFLFSLFFISSSFLAQDKNQAIIEYAKDHLNKKIDRGECWDLVSYALSNANADWNPPLDFGDEINPKKEKIQPGDIISFDGVRFENENGYMTFPMHYAIVYEVKSKDHIVIAHQNHNNVKKVQLLDLNLSEKKKGKLGFHRAK